MGWTLARSKVGVVVVATLVAAGPLATKPAAAEAVPTCPAPTATHAATWAGTLGSPPPGSSGTEIYPTWPAPAGHHDELDMDGDGEADDIALVDSDGGVDVHIVRGDGTLVVDLDLPLGAPMVVDEGGDDLDGDGHDEAFVHLYLHNPLGLWVVTTVIPGSTPVDAVTADIPLLRTNGGVVGDVTGDGLDDLALGVSQYTKGVHISGADALAATADPVDPDDPLASLDRIATLADLEVDGEQDVVHLGSSDGAIPARLVLSTGPTLALGGQAGADEAHVVVSGSRQYVRMTDLHGDLTQQSASHVSYRIRTGCARSWLRSVLPVLTGRTAVQPSDLADFGSETDPYAPTRTATALRLIRSLEGRTQLVRDSFDRYLYRLSDNVGRHYWTDALMSDRRTPTQMFALMLGSEEVAKKTDGSAEGWVRLVFPRATGRSVDRGGLAYWSKQFRSLGPVRTAARLLASPEARRFLALTCARNPGVLGPETFPSQVTADVTVLTEQGFDAFLAGLVSADRVYLRAQSIHRLEG